MGFVDLLFSFLFFMLMSISVTTSQPECYDTGSFTTNSTYGKYRNLILSSLASNVTGHVRFYTATVGQNPNKVYALGVCREDYSLESCASCVISATEDILTNCPNQKEALSWGLQHTLCIVRYAIRSFSRILELDPMTPGYNVGNITSNLRRFDQTPESLVDRLVNKPSKGSSKLKLATGEANFAYFQKIYALMQCSRDLSPTNCDTCLRKSLAYCQSCYHGKQGGYVLRPNCNFRWDLYPFYKIIANARSPSPPIANSAPPPQFSNTSHEKGGVPSFTVVTIIVCTIIFIALVAFTCIFLSRRKAQKQIRSKQRTADVVDEIETVDSLQFDFSTIGVARSDFSIANKLGEGGFCAVDKAVKLPTSLNCVGSSYPNHSTSQDVRIHKHTMDSTYLLTIVSYTLMSISLTAGQLQCYNTGNFTINSTYDQNRNIILSSLASNAVANGGFYNATIGQEPNRIYALADCSRDSSTEACARCVNATAKDIIAKCPNQKEAILWGTMHPLCIVHYANRSFLQTLEMDPMFPLVNTGNITSNMTEFDEIWESLMDRIVTKASMGSSRQFATSEANLTSFQKIYAMVQCAPYLSRTNCDYCLRTSVSDFERCCHGKQGGTIRRPSCFIRWDLYPFYELSADTPSPSPPTAHSTPPQFTDTTNTKDNEGLTPGTVVIIVVSTIIFMAIATFTYVMVKRKKKKKPEQDIRNVDDETETVESLQFDFNSIRAATNNFSIDNKLGQGGFGAVYKGRLPNGQDIAVKRLSRGSDQGEIEFKNEVLLVARLQHRNLVRLRGFCLEGTERILIYEFVPNSSLDNFIFDPTKRLLLDWERRYKIIRGIARGILYLHEDSRWRIIHRDLKVSNILLDVNMTPKIADFGMARLFEMDQTQGNTRRIVGTFGYMAPEYVRHGHFSVKSDVFSFGVLLLEIISGQKNSSFHDGKETRDLRTYAWKNWKEGTALNLVDPILRAGSNSEIMRCIHIGLLCVQENEANRPTMGAVLLMLSSHSLALPIPSKPAFFLHTSTEQGNSVVNVYDGSRSNSDKFTVNEASITELDPR